MSNIGEEIVGCYLQDIVGCNFVQYNLHHPDVQGEIDVIGLDMKNKTVYICEVVTHVVTGILYTKNNQPVNVEKLMSKFEKDVKYARKHFKGFKQIFMLWSPIVKPAGRSAKLNQMKDVHEVKRRLKSRFKVNLELVINERYLECLQQLREFAGRETKAFTSSVLRLMQIEEKSRKHVHTLHKRKTK